MIARSGAFDPELYALAAQYAWCADHRDGEGFAAVFSEDGVLRVSDSNPIGSAAAAMRGRDQLATVPGSLSKYDRTLHIVGTVCHVVGDGVASGEVYCVAHHVRLRGAGSSDHVMYIRYEDEYRRDTSGVWLIAERVVHLEWTERRPVAPPRS